MKKLILSVFIFCLTLGACSKDTEKTKASENRESGTLTNSDAPESMSFDSDSGDSGFVFDEETELSSSRGLESANESSVSENTGDIARNPDQPAARSQGKINPTDRKSTRLNSSH